MIRFTYDLLVTIFSPNTPLNDVAVSVQVNRIIAAIGITEETHAVAVIVSEETGIISAAVGGKITRNLDGTSLRSILHATMEGRAHRAAQPAKAPQEVV